MKITIDAGVSLKDIENINLEISSKRHESLTLPRKLLNKDFFVVASLIQSVSSWIRNNTNGTLIIPFGTAEMSGNSEEIREFMNEEFVYTSVLLAWPRVLDANGQPVTQDLKHYTGRTAASLNRAVDDTWRPLKGHSVILPCFDHFSEKGGLLNSFYQGATIFAADAFDLSPFSNRLSRLLKSINYNVGVNSFKTDFDNLTKIVYELILNTHEWARTDERNKKLFPNCRGVYMRVFKAPPKSFQSQTAFNSSIGGYFGAEDFKLNSNGELYAIEISVFDSGPGLVSRYLESDSEQLSTTEQVEIVKKCLTRHATSAKGQRSIHKGVGLDKVMSTLSEKGFFRIRTGSVCVYRNMRKNPYVQEANSSEIALFDWRTGKSDDFSTLPSATGTVVSLIYPMTFQ